MLDFESYIVKNSTKWSFSGFGSVKKRFFMAKSCLEHIPKLILIGKSMANCLKYWSRKSVFFQKAGNHAKRCALMRWSFSILNDNTKCLVWWVNNWNTEAKKARPKIMFFFKNGWEPSQKTRLDALIIFHIEWQHQVSCLVGKQSKYWSIKTSTTMQTKT